MKITKKTIQEMIREELKSLNERPRKLPRQLKDKKKEMLVVKNGKVQVIDKKDWNKYKRKGYLVAEKKNLKEFESEFKTYSKYNNEIEKVFKTIFGKQIKNVKQTKDGLTKVEFDTTDKSIRDINKASKKLIQKIEKILSKKFKQDVNVISITGGDDYLSYDIFSESVNEAKKLKKVKTDKYGNHLEPQFKKGDKVTYLGNKGVITGVNKESSGVYSYNVSYDKGNGKTKASNIFNKGGEIKNESVNEAKMTETLNITGYYGTGKSPKMTLNVDKLNANSPLEKIIHAYLDSMEELENSEYGSYSYDEADSDIQYLDGLLRKKKISNKELNKLYKKFSRDKKYPIIAEQNLNEKNAVSGGKVHPFITGLELKYKGKKHPEIEFEVQGIDNQSKLVKLRVLSPKQHFGDEMNVPFKTIRRGRFVKTDTSK